MAGRVLELDGVARRVRRRRAVDVIEEQSTVGRGGEVELYRLEERVLKIFPLLDLELEHWGLAIVGPTHAEAISAMLRLVTGAAGQRPQSFFFQVDLLLNGDFVSKN